MYIYIYIYIYIKLLVFNFLLYCLLLLHCFALKIRNPKDVIVLIVITNITNTTKNEYIGINKKHICRNINL